MRPLIFLVLLILVLAPDTVAPQEGEPNWPPIDIGNVHDLRSVGRVNFADFSQGLFRTGDFVIGYDESGNQGPVIAASAQDGQIFVWDMAGEALTQFASPTGDDAAVDVWDIALDRGILAILHTLGAKTVVSFDFLNAALDVEARPSVELPLLPGEQPLDLWIDGNVADTLSVFVETISSAPTASSRIIGYSVTIADLRGSPDTSRFQDLGAWPVAPDQDEAAVVRIGRIDAPVAVTSSISGDVIRWDLAEGEATAFGSVEEGPAVFGQISANREWLAWRDPQSTNLNLLNFESGESQHISPLNGQYVQAFFVGLQGDVILGVDVDAEPFVVAWDSATGHRYNLGAYRACSRVPDMIRLSRDASTLVIGCDTGFDIWRVRSTDCEIC